MTFTEATSIQSTGPKPHILSGAFLQILRSQFSDPNNITEEKLRGFLWSPDEVRSNILIEPLYRWDAKKIQQRPAILVKRGETKVVKLGIGDLQHGRLEDTGFVDMHQTTSFAGMHVIFCLGNSGLEAELIGSEVFYHFLEFSAVIRQQLCLGSFQVSDLGEVSRFEEAHDHFVVPVSLTYAGIHSWNVLRQTPEWTGTSFDVRIEE